MTWDGETLYERQGAKAIQYKFTDFDADAETTAAVRLNNTIELNPTTIVWQIVPTTATTPVIEITLEVSGHSGSFTIVDIVKNYNDIPKMRVVKVPGAVEIKVTATLIGSGNVIDVKVLVKE